MRGGIAGALAIVVLLAASCGKEAKAETLTFYEHDTQQTNVDLGKKGDSPGDLFVFSGDVFDRKGGTKLGRLGGHCETISTGSHGETRCLAIFTLEGGQIVTDALYDTAAVFGGKIGPLAITGGTGVYRNVRGHGTVQVPTDVPDQADANFVLNLTDVATR